MQVTKLHGGVRARTVAHRSTPVYVKHGDSSSLNGERHSGEVCDGVRVLLGRHRLERPRHGGGVVGSDVLKNAVRRGPSSI